jgi:tetratricopeptide (TPR) repeat protein
MIACVAALALVAALPPKAARPSGRPATAEAERLAAEAVRLSAAEPARALAEARRALALTVEFEPTAFVKAGRKGEVVEDAFQSARRAYKQHRAILYEAVGTVLAQKGELAPASRYLRRAFLLDPSPDRALGVARALVGLGRGREALEAVRLGIPGLAALTPQAVEVLTRAAEAAGLPSAQAEIDRGRLRAALSERVELREGPLATPAGALLSTAPVVHLEDAPLTVVYAAEASCHSCSTDLEELARQVPKDVRVLALPSGDDRDQALRQVLAVYRRPWPLLLGPDVASRLSLEPRSALLVARGGWTVAVVRPPFGATLGSAIAVLQKTDVQESVPRPAWNRRPVDRSPLPAAPGLLPDGLAPGEDEPFPSEFSAAVAAFRAGRKAEALASFEALEAKGDGWLLSPEARLDRALCLAGTGRRDAARRLLLRTGDSRFEAAIDRLLETVAAGK